MCIAHIWTFGFCFCNTLFDTDLEMRSWKASCFYLVCVDHFHDNHSHFQFHQKFFIQLLCHNFATRLYIRNCKFDVSFWPKKLEILLIFVAFKLTNDSCESLKSYSLCNLQVHKSFLCLHHLLHERKTHECHMMFM